MTNETPSRRLTGKVRAEAVHELKQRIPIGLIERFRRLSDPSGTVSDALDEFGVRGCVPASHLRPTIPGSTIVGTAITVRNVPQQHEPHVSGSRRISRLGEIEAHNLALPGDVLVIQGVRGASNLGGISSSIGQRQGEIGAIVDGGVRDVGSSRNASFPIWSTEVIPATGKFRAETVEINGVVAVGGVAVRAGDLVIADDTGVCIIPSDWAERVLARAEEIAEGERARMSEIASGLEVPELADRTYAYQIVASVE